MGDGADGRGTWLDMIKSCSDKSVNSRDRGMNKFIEAGA